MSEEVTAIEVERVRPEVPPRPEVRMPLIWDGMYWRSQPLHLNDSAEYTERRLEFIRKEGELFMVLVPSERKFAYLKRQAELLEEALGWFARPTGDESRRVRDDKLVEIANKIGALDAEWEKAKNA
jgi:hypothetical protein